MARPLLRQRGEASPVRRNPVGAILACVAVSVYFRGCNRRPLLGSLAFPDRQWKQTAKADDQGLAAAKQCEPQQNPLGESVSVQSDAKFVVALGNCR